MQCPELRSLAIAIYLYHTLIVSITFRQIFDKYNFKVSSESVLHILYLIPSFGLTRKPFTLKQIL